MLYPAELLGLTTGFILTVMMPKVPILFQGVDEWHPDMLRFA